MSDEFYMASQGQSYCVRGGETTQLAIDLEKFDSFKHKSGSVGSCDESIVLVQQVAVSRAAITVPVVGVDKKRLLYSFGENFGQVRIVAIILTGGTKYAAKEPKGIVDAWEQNGVVGSKKPVNLKWAGSEAKVFVTAVTVASQEVQLGTIKVELQALIAPVTNKHS